MIKKSINKSNEMFITKLDHLIDLICSLKEDLGLTESCLSEKIEKTQLVKVKIAEYKEKKRQECFKNPANLSQINNHDDFLIKIESELKLEGLHDKLQNYFNEIIDLINIDKSAAVYFYLYKSAKLIINLLNFKEFINDFYLNSFFKKLETTKNNGKMFFGDGLLLKNGLKNLKSDDKTNLDIEIICEKINKLNFNYYDEDDDDFSDLIKRQNLSSKHYNGSKKMTENGYESCSNKTSDDEESYDEIRCSKRGRGGNICKYIEQITYNKSKSNHKLFIFG
jgi:hypothetical protein